LAQDAVSNWGVTIEIAQARTVGDFDAAFASLVARRINALATQSDALFISGYERLVALATHYAIPMILSTTASTKVGGLMSYTSNTLDELRQIGRYAGRILKGEKPANLPVLLPTKFEFSINLKTAKTLGIEIPSGVLAIADEVIE
jgi:putative ABC transport system substrate-binding protein